MKVLARAGEQKCPRKMAICKLGGIFIQSFFSPTFFSQKVRTDLCSQRKLCLTDNRDQDVDRNPGNSTGKDWKLNHKGLEGKAQICPILAHFKYLDGCGDIVCKIVGICWGPMTARDNPPHLFFL